MSAVRPARPLPETQQRSLRRAEHLEYWTIGLQVAVTVMMFVVMGSSQAMKTVWVEDVPPIAFLGGCVVLAQAPGRGMGQWTLSRFRYRLSGISSGADAGGIVPDI